MNITFKRSLLVLRKVLSWLIREFLPVSSNSHRSINTLISSLEVILLSRGCKGLITYCKTARLALLHFLSGESSLKRVTGIELSKDGLPKVLESFRENIVKEDIPIIRLILTVLFFTRVYNVGREPDIKPITTPSSFVDDGRYDSSIKEFWKSLHFRRIGKRVPQSLQFKNYHLSTKAGPNGQALWFSLTDLSIILMDEYKPLFEAIKILGGPLLKSHLEILERYFSLIPKFLRPVGRSLLRKLSYFPAQESKVRVVAQLDYISQTALRPFHDYLFRVLRMIPQDCTFNQRSFKDKVTGWETYHSCDLSQATDRFPIKLIAKVLKGHFPEKFVDAWLTIMVGYPFAYFANSSPAQHEKSLNCALKVAYSAGNPMGAYSSWNSFTLSHHFVMYHCCRQLGIDFSTAKYVILGDDVLIGPRDLAEAYLAEIKFLGVEISDLKSHQSNKLFEFAKRLFLNGEEITAFPVSALKESSRGVHLMTNLLIEEIWRGWISLNGIPAGISRFYSEVLERNSTFCAKALKAAYLTEYITKVMHGTSSAYDLVSGVIRQFDLKPIGGLDEELSLEIISSSTAELFIGMNPLIINRDDKWALGSFRVWIDNCLDRTELSDMQNRNALLKAIPIFDISIKIEIAYAKLKRQSFDLVTLGKGDWPLVLRNLALPKTDKIFVQRKSDTLLYVKARLGPIVLKRIMSLQGEDLSLPIDVQLERLTDSKIER